MMSSESQSFRKSETLSPEQMAEENERLHALEANLNWSVNRIQIKVKDDKRQTHMYAIIVAIIVCIPGIVCDLYYAQTDSSCVHNTTSNMNLTLYDYLMVSSIFNIVSTFILVILFSCIRKIEVYEVVITFIGKFTMMFIISWTIIGALLFWEYIDTEHCSKPVYTYLIAIIIIRLVSCGMTVVQNSSSGKK